MCVPIQLNLRDLLFGKWQVQNFSNATVLGQQVFNHLSEAIVRLKHFPS
jgi:hypothetical protein